MILVELQGSKPPRTLGGSRIYTMILSESRIGRSTFWILMGVWVVGVRYWQPCPGPAESHCLPGATCLLLLLGWQARHFLRECTEVSGFSRFRHIYVHSCMYVCMNVCMYVCTYVRMCTYIHIYIYAYIVMYIYVCIYTYRHIGS